MEQIYKSNVEEQINKIIGALEILKKQKDIMNIDFIAPHIEEIGGDSFSVYGVLKTSFEITYEGTYKKVNNVMAEWEKIDKEK